MSEFILIHCLKILCLKGGAFDSIFCSEMRIFGHNDCPGRRVFALFKSCPGFVRGGGGLDEIDTCISHLHVKSDIARPTSIDQVIGYWRS